MKNKIKLLSILIAFGALGCQRQNTETLSGLFNYFKTAAKKNDENKLKEMTIDYVVRKPKINLQEAIIKGVKEYREKGDFAYSEQAIKTLITKHISDFKNISEEELQQIKAEFGFEQHPQLSQLKSDDVWRLDIPPTKVVALRIDGAFRLFYWRDLTSLAH